MCSATLAENVIPSFKNMSIYEKGFGAIWNVHTKSKLSHKDNHIMIGTKHDSWRDSTLGKFQQRFIYTVVLARPYNRKRREQIELSLSACSKVSDMLLKKDFNLPSAPKSEPRFRSGKVDVFK